MIQYIFSHRKGYTRAPFDDWRRGGDAGEPGAGGQQPDGEGWKTTGAGSRRWGGAGAGLERGQGWRTERENYNRASGNRPPTNDRWRRDDEPRGGFSQRGGHGFGRQRSKNDSDHLPEWATDDPSEGGTFDTEGKFRADQQKNGITKNGENDWIGESENNRWEDEEVDPEDVEEEPEIVNNNRDDSRKDVMNGSNGNGSFEKEERPSKDSSSTPSSWESPPSESEKREASVEDPGKDLEAMAGNIVASLVGDEDESPPKQESPPASSHPPAPVPAPVSTWSYLDPQGQVQGPFQSDEMLEWYSAGYFPPDLMLRRSCDKRFVSLKDLKMLYGRVPFTPGPSPPPLVDNQEEERMKQLQQQQMLHQQQLLMQQQMLAQQQQQQQQQQQHHHHHQQQQHMMGIPGHGPDINKLLQFGGNPPQHHGLGSLGLGDMSRAFPDPRMNLLGNLGDPRTNIGDPQSNDPLKQLMARSQAGPAMPGLGRSFSSNSPPQVAQPQDPFPPSLFGIAQSVSEPPPINIPFSKPPVVNNPPPTNNNFDPIQSLLAQLQGNTSQPSSPQLLRGPGQPSVSEPPAPAQFNHRPPQSIWDMPVSEPEPVIPDHNKPMTSIWNDPISGHPEQSESPVHPREMMQSKDEIELPIDDNNQDEFDNSESNSQDLELVPSETELTTNFVKPKANEKKDKKSKKAEEKRKAKEAKKAAEAAGPYIPGMSGTVRPDEQIIATGNILDLKEEEKFREQQDALRRQREQMEALAKLQEDQKAKLEREEQIRIQQERLSKLAPWAKKEGQSPVKEGGHGLTLQEIQRLEAERERKERQVREVQEARIREEQRRVEEEERSRRAAKTINWATAAAPTGGNGNKVKSLAEIQAEEARVERERQERELAARSVGRSSGKHEPQSPSGSIWSSSGSGSGKSGTTWAGKIAANTPATPSQTRSNAGNPWSSSNGSAAPVVAPAGFWDPVIPDNGPQQMKKQASTANINNNQAKNNKNQKKKDDDRQDNRKQKTPKNEFEDWCTRALSELQAQVDIPTFLGFLMDIESPYDVSIKSSSDRYICYICFLQVHDYVKSYVGEGKAQKKFATDYLERRSRWKNSLKGGARYEDDLTTPATALTPGDGEFQEAGKKGRNKKLTKQSKSKQDISHLLGFSVSGQGVNRGELDMPQ